MKQGIYNYSPVLEYSLENCGDLFINLAEKEDDCSFYYSKQLYVSNSINGINLSIFINDYDNQELNVDYSYNMHIVNNGDYILLKTPNNCIDKYEKVTTENSESNIYYHKNNFTSIEIVDGKFILKDESKVEYCFSTINGLSNYYLESIIYPYTEESITISRDSYGKLTAIINNISKEKLTFETIGNLTTIKVFRLVDEDYILIYEYQINHDTTIEKLTIKEFNRFENIQYNSIDIVNDFELLTVSESIDNNSQQQLIPKTFVYEKWISLKYYNNYTINYNYDEVYNECTITNNYNSDSYKYYWDENKRLTHIKNLKDKTISYFGYNDLDLVVANTTNFYYENINLNPNLLYDFSNDCGLTYIDLNYSVKENDIFSFVFSINCINSTSFDIVITFEKTLENLGKETQTETFSFIKHSSTEDDMYYSISTIAKKDFDIIKINIVSDNDNSFNNLFIFASCLTNMNTYFGKQLINSLNGTKLTKLKLFDTKIYSMDDNHYTYDKHGRVETIEDNKGNKKTFTYSTETGNIESIRLRNKANVLSFTNDYLNKFERFTYNTYNQQETYKKDDITEKNTYKVDGSILKKQLYDNKFIVEDTLLQEATYSYQNTFPNVKSVSNNYGEKSETLSYSYIKNNLDSIEFNNKIINYTIDNLYDLVNEFYIGNYKHLEFDYHCNSNNIQTNDISMKKYINHTFYFYYDEYNDLVSIKYSSNDNVNNKITICTINYVNLNNKKLVNNIIYSNNINHNQTCFFHYNKKGDLIGTSTSYSYDSYKTFSNGNSEINMNDDKLVLTDTVYHSSKIPLTYSEKIRDMKENIKLCDFSKLIGIGDNNSSYSFLYNTDIDNFSDGNITQCGSSSSVGIYYKGNVSQQVDSDDIQSFLVNEDDVLNDGTYNYIHIKNYNPTFINDGSLSNSEINDGNYKLLHFDFNINGRLTSSWSSSDKRQTIAFMFKHTSIPNYTPSFEDCVLCELKNGSKSYYLVLHKAQLGVEIVFCIELCEWYYNENIFKVLASSSYLDPEIYTDKWCFVALTLNYSYDYHKLYINGESYYLHPDGGFDKIYIDSVTFGSISEFNYLNSDIQNQTCQIMDFELTNILLSYQSWLDTDTINQLYNTLKSKTNIEGNSLLSTNYNYSTTTFNKVLSNDYYYFDYISFNKNLLSARGMNPTIDYRFSSLDETNDEIFVFDEETKNFVYKFSGKKLEYNINDYTNNILISNSLGLSFKLKSTKSVNSSNSILSINDINLITLKNNTLTFNGDGNSKSISIETNKWNYITLSIERMVDECLNYTNKYKYKLYLGTTLQHQFILSSSFEPRIIFDSDTNTNQDIMVKDLYISSTSFNENDITKFVDADKINYVNSQYDTLERLKKQSIYNNGNSVITYNYSYKNNGLLDYSKKNIDSDTTYKEYEYDSLGKITKINNKNSLFITTSSHNFVYDSKSELLSENLSGTMYQYSYDDFGNITSITNGDNNIQFNYDEFNRLVKFGDMTVEYDSNKNQMISLFPKKIGTNEYTWIGAKLMSIVGERNISFNYNINGLRTLKKDNAYNKNHFYFYDNYGKLIIEKIVSSSNTQYITYLYHNNLLYGFEYNNDKYFYDRDALGNIDGIVDENGITVVTYTYNAFGKTIDISGELKDTIGVINPFRYKGYYYDVETQLFYCNSRYYSPELCRFISPDSIEYLDPQSINGLNLYCYCMNNPIMYADPSGHMPEWAQWLIGGALVVGAIALTICTAGAGGALALALGGGFWTTVASGAFVGALVGAASGALMSAGTQIIANGFEDFSWREVGKGAITGGIAGGIAGGLFAGIQYGLTADKIATGISGINNAKTGLSNAWKPLSNIKNFTNMPFSGANIARTVGQAASNYNNAYTAYVLANGTYEIAYTAAKVLYFGFECLASDLIGLMF